MLYVNMTLRNRRLVISLPNAQELDRLLGAFKLLVLHTPPPRIRIFVDEADEIYKGVKTLLLDQLPPGLVDRTELNLVTAA